MEHESEGGQFTTRGMFALVAACAIVAAILRYTTTSFTAMAAGFVVGTTIALMFVFAGTAIDAIERRAQSRWAKSRAEEPLETTAAGTDASTAKA